MTAAANRKLRLHAIMIRRCQGDENFVALNFNQWEFSISGEFTNSKDASIFLNPHPHPVQPF